MSDTPDADHLRFIRARLVEVYGVDPHVDYIARLDTIIKKVEAVERLATLFPPKP